MLVPSERRPPVAAAVFGLAVAGVMIGVAVRGLTVRAPSALLDYGGLPEFSLIDHQRQPFTRSTMAGSVWIADFIFTRCAGQCPLLSAEMATLQRKLQDAPGVRFISFSVDPSYDTPEVLAAYAAHYSARADQWRFITGEPAAMTVLIRQGFHLAFGASDSAKEPITHSVRFVLVDQRGSIRGSYDATDAQAIARLTHDAKRLSHATP